MRRAILLALLLLPAAHAQALDAGPIEVERLRAVPALLPLEHGGVAMAVRYDCRDVDPAMDDLRLVVDANATTRRGMAVPVDYTSVQVIDLDECGIPADAVGLDVVLSFTMPHYQFTSILDVRATLSVRSSEGVLHRTAGDPVDVSVSIPMLVRPEETPQVLEAEAEASDEEPMEVYAPGPAVPLLVAGLGILGRMRRL